MRARMFVLTVCAVAAVSSADAHGPQIQTTLTEGKIVTRKIVDDDSYNSALTDPKSVYVMPLTQYLGVWRAQPDNALLPDGTPEFVGWPGFAYGFGYDADTNPAPFPVGSKFVLGFTAGLESWDGAAFADAGITEAEAFRGSSATPTALARSSDIGPFQNLMFPGGSGVSFASEGADVHNTVNYRMLGDGVSPASPLDDGIYLLSFQLSSTDSSVAASDPFYFVLHKNPATGAIARAVDSLGVDPSLVQVVPEPAAWLLVVIGCGALGRIRCRQTRRDRR